MPIDDEGGRGRRDTSESICDLSQRIESHCEERDAALAEAPLEMGVRGHLPHAYPAARHPEVHQHDLPAHGIARLQCGEQGDDPRYIVTNLDRDAITLYDTVYCARGEMENRIQEAQPDAIQPGQTPDHHHLVAVGNAFPRQITYS